MKKFVTILLVLCLFFTTATFAKKNDSFLETNSLDKWTVMYYMCCDSNMYPLGPVLLENLSQIGSSSDLNLIAMYDGDPYGDSEVIYFNETGERINLNEKIGWPSEIDYSDPLVLEQFVKDMMSYYPAEYYALIFYGSAGTGWQQFCVHDADGTTYKKFVSRGSSGFSTPRTADAFKNITRDGEEKIDVIYTSCAMNTIELAYELRSYVSYLVGTQDCLSRDVAYRYYESVWELSNNTDMSPDEFSECSADILRPKSFYYQDEWDEKFRWLNTFFMSKNCKELQTVKHHDNVGVINNSNIVELIESVDNLSRYLILNIHDKEIFDDISHARDVSRESSKCYAKPGSMLMRLLHRIYRLNISAYDGVIDLYGFCEELEEITENLFLKHYCKEVMENVNKSAPYLNKVENDQIHGFNIYFPREKDIYNKFVGYGDMPCLYEELAFSKDTAWDEFLKTYLNI